MKLLRPYNPLVYPGGLSGFDPSHPASVGIHGIGYGVSAICTGTGNFINLLGGSTPTPSGAALVNLGAIGPAVSLQNNTNKVTFSAEAKPGTLESTFGMVLQFQGPQSGPQALGYVGTTNALYVSGNTVSFFYGGADHLFTSVSLNVPYFLAASAKSGVGVNFALTNLNTGQTQLLALSSASTYVEDTPIVIGDNQASQHPQTSFAAVMYSHAYMSLNNLAAWAANPWSFWYPKTQQQLIFDALAHQVAVSAVVFRKTLSTIGGRVGTRQPQGWAN